MFLWVGCKLPQEFSGELRSRCLGLKDWQPEEDVVIDGRIAVKDH